MGADQIEVFPEGDKWYYREHTAAGGYRNKSDSFDDRGSAIAGARGEASVPAVEELYNAGGEPRGISPKRPGALRVVLLRADGSEYGELDAGPSAGGEALTAQVETATEHTGG